MRRTTRPFWGRESRHRPKWVLANTSGGGTDADRVVRQVPATIEEFALRPLAQTWAQFQDLADTVARRLALTEPPGYLILDSLSTGGSPTDPRTRMAALAYYYLLADPDATFYGVGRRRTGFRLVAALVGRHRVRRRSTETRMVGTDVRRRSGQSAH